MVVDSSIAHFDRPTPQMIPVLVRLFLIPLLLVPSLVTAQTMIAGRNPLVDDGDPDDWSSLIVMTPAITGPGGGIEQGTVTIFNFWADSSRADGLHHVTPILVRRSGGSYRIAGIGATRSPLSGGAKSEPFALSAGSDRVDLSGAAAYHIAVLQQWSGGDDDGGSLIPSGESGGGGMFLENTVGPSHVPARGDIVGNNFASGPGGRNYSFNFEIEFAASPQPPTDISLIAGDLFPGLPVGTGFGVLASVDPNANDTHTYSLVINPGGVFAIDGDQLKPAAPVGPVGTNYTIRVRSTDSGMLSFEKDLNLSVVAALPPSDLTLSGMSLNTRSPAGALVGTLDSVDGNKGDQHIYSLVAGVGDEGNGLFTIVNDNELRLAEPVPAGHASLDLRIRTTDLSGASHEKSFRIEVLAPSLRINEFLASNTDGIQDEDRDSSDWIEIYNGQDVTVNLDGWSLTDDRGDLAKWRFPSVELQPDDYLVVFASGKNRARAGRELHANFELGSGGEFLALVMPDGVTIADQYAFAPQFPDLSFGYSGSRTDQGFLVPTAGTRNGRAFEFGLNEVSFSSGRGFYEERFRVRLTSAVPGSTIRYTTDGSKPSATNGSIYGEPILIRPDPLGDDRGTRIVRAIAIHPSAAVQKVDTHTYLFVNGAAGPSTDGVVGQTVFRSSITNHPTYGPLMDDALLAQPAISIVGGLPGSVESERSVEFFTPDGSEAGFQIDCGVKLVGGHSVGSPKNNFRLYFRGEYGNSKLRYDLFKDHPYSTGATDVFDRLNLRSGSHDSFFWLANPGNPSNSGGPQRGDAQYLRNRWIADMQFLMGHESLHGRWAHLYVNGAYHGHYHLHEWPNDDFLASYLPGEAVDYEYTNGANTSKAGSDNWQAAWSALKSAANTNYGAAMRWIDLENLADYQLLNFYAGNPWDWNPNQNWMAGGPNRSGSPSGGWKFFGWDSDICLQDPAANVLQKDVPDGLFGIMMRDEDFRVLFRDRVYKHCFHRGVLTSRRVAGAHRFRADQIRTSIIAETARWQGGAASPPWDRDGEWQAELNRMAGYFLVRTDNLLNQLRARPDWYPLEAPEFDQRGGFVAAGHTPSLSAPSGRIYYTTDGSDPRLSRGTVNPSAEVFQAGKIVIDSATVLRTRVFNGSTWSALNEAGFVIIGTQPAATSNITISEVNYHAYDLDDYEYIEFKNTSAASVDFGGVTISEAVDFTFPLGSVVPPGGHIVVVEDAASFASRYSTVISPWYFPGIVVGGEWSGMLRNNSEAIVVNDASGDPLLTVNYKDAGSWPGRADGRGSAAELIDPAAIAEVLPDKNLDLDKGNNWRPTSEFHGSPGRDGAGADNRVVFNEILSNPNPPGVDAFELLNTQSGAIGIGEWFVSDDADDFRKFRLPAGTSIAGDGLLLFDENTFNNPADPNSLVPFALSGSKGDDLFLLEPDLSGNLLRFVDRAEFGAAAQGESLGRWPDGNSGDFYPMVAQTLGELNSTGGNSVRVGSVVLVEIHYNPEGPDQGREFISICNAGPAAENLQNWQLRGEVDFDFSAATTLQPGAFLVIVDFDPADAPALNAFRAEYGLDLVVPIVGPWTDGGAVPTRLSDGGGAVRLLRPDAFVIPGDGSPAFYPMLGEDLVNYNDLPPWPLSPDGAGASLVRIDVAHYGDDPLNWEASSAPLSGVSYETWAANTFPAGTAPADRLAEADPDLDGLTNFGEFGFVLDPLNGGARSVASVESAPTGDAVLIRYRRRPGAHFLRYAVGISSDLVAWDYGESALEFVSATPQPDGSVEVTMRHPNPLPPPRFFQVRVWGD